MEELKRTCYSGKPSSKDKGVCKAGIQACKNGQWGSCKFVGAIRAGSKKQDVGVGLGLDALGHLFVVGHFSGTADFGQNSLVSKGKENGFIWRLSSSAL